MFKAGFLSILVACLCQGLLASETIISGKAPSYAGKEIVFYRTSDWITGTEDVAAKCMVSDSGVFETTINLETTIQLYAYLGIYLGYFFAEPGKSYELVLPDFREKTQGDFLNPYFEPVEIHLGLSNFNSDDLNMLIVMFDDAYVPYYDKHVNSIYSQPDFQKIDQDIKQIDEPFKEYTNEYFRNYRKYRYGMLKMLANRQRVQSLSDEYFNNQPVLYTNVAYSDLFNQVFHKYFSFFGRTDSGKKIFNDINEKGNFRELIQTLEASSNFDNDTLTELIILKQLHDEYYGSEFSRNGIIRILDTLMSSTHISEHARIGGIIRHKITRLQPGYEPPSFELEDTNGKLIKLSDLKGRYVYLNFCTCQSYACLNEFNQLAALHQRHKDRLTIVTVSTDPQEEILRQFLAKNKYDWIFLHYDNQPGILKEYDIRAFPTYFLIGPDGRLIASPAVSPSENFEQRLFEIMKSRGDL
ncbi:MAG TPA: TlpA disulfide reductase family protein [Bacteroidales bacterium]|nr:TlpA disulfide reductase family protein [Bacteroidales bacterium]